MKSHLLGFGVFGPDADTAPQRLSELFHENTKLRSPFAPELPVALASAPPGPAAQRHKRFPQAPSFALPPWEQAGWATTNLAHLIAQRRTFRNLRAQALPHASLSALLHCANGLALGQPHRRAVPSAGALFPLEIYVAANACPPLPPGLYHYGPGDHALAQLDTRPPAPLLKQGCLDGGDLSAAPVVLLIAAVLGRTTAKYGDRGYRYILLEAGHMAQNIALAATALGLATFPVGGFLDDPINAWLGVDGVNEVACYLIGIGTPAV